MLQTLKLNNKKQKKSSFYEEKRLVGLTPGRIHCITNHQYTLATSERVILIEALSQGSTTQAPFFNV
jgi:hypothetical protein